MDIKTNRTWAWTLAAILATFLVTGCTKKDKPLPIEVAQLLRQTVQNRTLPASLRDQKELQRAWTELQGFYDRHGYQPVWSNARGPRQQSGELLQAIPPLAVDGLDVRRYQPERIAALLKEVKEMKSFDDDPQAQRRLVDLDVELTYTYLSLASHLATGRLQPEKLRIDWYTKPRNVDLDARLDQALTADSPGEIVKILRSLTPPYADYQRLTKALAAYKAIAAKGGWNPVSPGPPLKTGDRGPRVAALRARLTASGDLAAPAPNTVADSYDGTVAAAVSHFQTRHGLEVTGKVDSDTLAELNVPVVERIRQIQVNQERWRWMPGSLGDRYILVNVPEFRLDVVDHGQTPLSMRVIVGKTQSRTPAFSDKMTYIELNPEWNLPADIVANEILSKVASNPGYLASHDMEVVKGWGDKEEVVDPSSVDLSQLAKNGYRLRQRAGDENPLGKIKFMFPNDFDVYLHDTPAHHLFNRAERDFSHGCVRLEKPLDLAAYLLKDDPKWTPEAIQAAIDSGEHQTISLPRPLPVHILYWTAWADADGTVQFRKDIYGHDAELEQALAKEPPVWIDPGTLREDVRAAK